MDWSISYEFGREHINRRAPTSRGLYCFLIANEIIYIGQARNLKRRLLEHLNPRRRKILLARYMKQGGCSFAFVPVGSDADLIEVEREQIRRHNPPCNNDIKTIEETRIG